MKLQVCTTSANAVTMQLVRRVIIGLSVGRLLSGERTTVQHRAASSLIDSACCLIDPDVRNAPNKGPQAPVSMYSFLNDAVFGSGQLTHIS